MNHSPTFTRFFNSKKSQQEEYEVTVNYAPEAIVELVIVIAESQGVNSANTLSVSTFTPSSDMAFWASSGCLWLTSFNQPISIIVKASFPLWKGSM